MAKREIPKSIRGRPAADVIHPIMPKYAPFGQHQKPQLEKVTHKARDLLNFTVMAFHTRRDCDLSKRQIAAREAFTARFRDRKQFYGGDPDVAPLDEFRHDVQCLANSLDEFFFFKLLGQYMKLKSGIDVVGRDPMGIDARIEGETFACKMRDDEFIQINVNIGSDEKGLYELSAIVGQLIHEMVHAYFLNFACDCWRCKKDRLNTVGVEHDGHGPLFLILHRLILTEVRNWGELVGDGELRMLLAEDCPGDSASKSAIARARLAIGSLTRQEKRNLNNVRSTQTKGYSIRLQSESKTVIVSPARQNKQLRMEDILRAKERREKQFRKDLLREGQNGVPNDGDYDDIEEDSEESSEESSHRSDSSSDSSEL
ncbi:hypothetical protein GGS26DRAFT_597931 [Hypomontagnella submonticulosa]|nr:hypothetical protein GGS26DRAFT_597931 [Hypomontagnella submonticulosa]